MSPAKQHKAPAAEQLPFDFPALNSQSIEDLAVGESNRAAVRLVDSWPDWPGHVLILTGPQASGKTHLARVFEKRADARWFTPDSIRMEPGGMAVILDDADRVEDETQLFHLFNWVGEQGGYLLMTAREMPAKWNIELPDLSSRLLAAPSVSIKSPDESLLAAVMIKQFTDRQIIVDENVIAYLMPRMVRSFEAVRDMVERLDKRALEAKRKITVPLVRSVLEDDMKLL